MKFRCQFCHKLFVADRKKGYSANRLKKRPPKFCSQECRRKFWSATHSFIRKCDICHKNYKVQNWEKEHSRFCSYKCRAVWSKEMFTGNKSPRFKGSKIKGGYKLIWIKSHPFMIKTGTETGYILEHRFLMEEYLKKNNPNSEFLININNEKYLNPKFIVHHKNKNTLDNRIENLECLTPQQHNTIHHTRHHPL